MIDYLENIYLYLYLVKKRKASELFWSVGLFPAIAQAES